MIQPLFSVVVTCPLLDTVHVCDEDLRFRDKRRKMVLTQHRVCCPFVKRAGCECEYFTLWRWKQ